MDNEENLVNRLLAEYNDRFESDSESDSIDNSPKFPINIVHIRGFRKNSHIIWDGKYLYYKNALNNINGIVACTCYEKNCNARIFIRKDETAYKLRTTEHSNTHGTMYDIFRHMHCFNLMKDRCLTAPASMSVREIYNEIILE